MGYPHGLRVPERNTSSAPPRRGDRLDRSRPRADGRRLRVRHHRPVARLHGDRRACSPDHGDGAILGRNTARSVNRLSHEASRMEAGDLDVDLETNRVDEIGQLYVAFDNMRLSLRDRMEETRRARRKPNASDATPST
ncbi:HAMP domain-containing protein [Natrialba swarupiae]|nr:HAMP domain-containing protein [Natrialba swarupiae]